VRVERSARTLSGTIERTEGRPTPGENGPMDFFDHLAASGDSSPDAALDSAAEFFSGDIVAAHWDSDDGATGAAGGGAGPGAQPPISGSPRCAQSGSVRCPQSGSPRCPASGSPRCPASGSPRCPASGSPRCPKSGSPRCKQSGTIKCTGFPAPLRRSPKKVAKKATKTTKPAKKPAKKK
jgi:hypothetical protein